VRAFRCHPGAIVSDVHFTYGHHTKPKLVRTRREKDVNRIDCRQSLIEIQLSGFSSMALRSLLVPSTMGQPQPGHVNPPADSKHFLPSLYVLNINSLTKPHAKEQLLADLQHYRIGISTVSESRFKKHQSAQFSALQG